MNRAQARQDVVEILYIFIFHFEVNIAGLAVDSNSVPTTRASHHLNFTIPLLLIDILKTFSLPPSLRTSRGLTFCLTHVAHKELPLLEEGADKGVHGPPSWTLPLMPHPKGTGG